jgi:hypothetical protein
VAGFGISLIVVALISGVAGCWIPPIDYYDLTMKVDPAGGGHTTPSETGGPYSYKSPWIDLIEISATPIGTYLFSKWTTDPTLWFADTSVNPTGFFMPEYDVTVTAHFVPLDHFKCYTVVNSSYIGKVVGLKDQFGTFNATVKKAEFFCNPTEKWWTPGAAATPAPVSISNPNHHLTVYNITIEPGPVVPQSWQVVVENQFGIQNLTVTGPVALAAPTWKLSPGNHSAPVGLDHFLLYKITYGSPINQSVNLQDEFDTENVTVYEPLFLANPVQKAYDGNVANITAPEAHLVFYRIGVETFSTAVQVNNQFGNQTLYVGNPALLAVPSEKSSSEELSFSGTLYLAYDDGAAAWVNGNNVVDELNTESAMYLGNHKWRNTVDISQYLHVGTNVIACQVQNGHPGTMSGGFDAAVEVNGSFVVQRGDEDMDQTTNDPLSGSCGTNPPWKYWYVGGSTSPPLVDELLNPWYAPNYADSTWKTGPSPFGDYNCACTTGILTAMETYGPSDAFFRTSFVVSK